MLLSIIIPTLNESEYLPATICAVRQNSVLAEPPEVIVVDCGSTDGTAGLAKESGARLIQIESKGTGRAQALNEGASLAAGKVFLFLDADTIPPWGYDQAIHAALKISEVVGGAFEFALDGDEFGLRVVEFINRLRYRIRQRYYGDQGIFVRASVFRKLGGYPPRRILEASDFCGAMRREGKIVLIPAAVKTSPRRFLEGGIYRVLARDIKIWWLDLMGLEVEVHAEDYWKENLRRGDYSPKF